MTLVSSVYSKEACLWQCCISFDTSLAHCLFLAWRGGGYICKPGPMEMMVLWYWIRRIFTSTSLSQALLIPSKGSDDLNVNCLDLRAMTHSLQGDHNQPTHQPDNLRTSQPVRQSTIQLASQPTNQPINPCQFARLKSYNSQSSRGFKNSQPANQIAIQLASQPISQPASQPVSQPKHQQPAS